ncbi:MAG: hypothetical protein WAL40_16485, partial [Rhodoplanes sp.]
MAQAPRAQGRAAALLDDRLAVPRRLEAAEPVSAWLQRRPAVAAEVAVSPWAEAEAVAVSWLPAAGAARA